jgi:3'(2'), 5'-bisphosphate nucleotidase
VALKPDTKLVKDLLLKGIEAAIRGSEEILKIYEHYFEVQIKSDNSPVTIADHNSNDAILKVLDTTGIPILSEESEQVTFDKRKNWQKFWLVDPLDGTKQFIKRNDEFTVNVALVDIDGPLIGILYHPVTDVLYFSERGNGAYRIDNANGISSDQIFSSSVKLTGEPRGEVTVTINRSSIESVQMQQFLNKVKQTEKIEPKLYTSGSALKFGIIADGNASYYPRFKPSMEWDTAAGHGIVKELGYTVVNADTKEELKYNKPSLLNPSFIVCKPERL